MAHTLKDTINEIATLRDNPDATIMDALRPWMVITGLSFKDALHLSYPQVTEGLFAVYNKLEDVIDVLDDDQIQEAACRSLKKITVVGDTITDGDVAVRSGKDISWDGTTWAWISDPKLRQRNTSKSYREALSAVLEELGR